MFISKAGYTTSVWLIRDCKCTERFSLSYNIFLGYVDDIRSWKLKKLWCLSEIMFPLSMFSRIHEDWTFICVKQEGLIKSLPTWGTLLKLYRFISSSPSLLFLAAFLILYKCNIELSFRESYSYASSWNHERTRVLAESLKLDDSSSFSWR